jgi:hypothetical protein
LSALLIARRQQTVRRTHRTHTHHRTCIIAHAHAGC